MTLLFPRSYVTSHPLPGSPLPEGHRLPSDARLLLLRNTHVTATSREFAGRLRLRARGRWWFFRPGHSAASALFVVSPAFPPLFTLEVESPVVIYGLCKSSQDASDGINC